MLFIDRLNSTAAVARLRAQVDRLRHRVMASRPMVRWSLALAVILALVAVSYWGASSLTTFGVRYLASERKFSSDDLLKVCNALDKQLIQYRVDEQRRVEVAADQFAEAAELVSKLDLGQHPIDEIRGEFSGWNFWQSSGEREHQELLRCERMIERLIGEQEGVKWSVVSINRPRGSMGSRSSSKPSAFVYVETEGGRSLPSRTVQTIPVIAAGYVPDLTPGSVTVMDRRGKKYLEPGNPALGDHSRNRVREEEISEEILEKLDWIKGVRVAVQVVTPREAMTGTETAGAGGTPKRPGATDQSPHGDDHGAISGRRDTLSSTIKLNEPLGPLEPDREPVSQTHPTVPRSQAITASTSRSGHAGESSSERGRILIYVPRSFYYGFDLNTNEREPSRDDLRLVAERTEKQIRTAVALVIPDAESWKVDVDMIWDEVSLNRPLVLPASAQPRHRLLEWGIAGAVGVASVLILAAVGSWIHVARRPVRLPEPAVTTRHFHVDSVSEPGPSERVRELIQRNPEAAASVLQRWMGQGGRAS
jgi:flagellar M-ring protein FliF